MLYFNVVYYEKGGAIMKKGERTFMRAAAIIVCLVVLTICLCAIGAPHHSCLGKRCTVCCHLDAIKKLLQFHILAVCGMCAVMIVRLLRTGITHVLAQNYTPLSMKVKLLN